MAHTITEGFADEIALSNGKLFYTGCGSVNSKIAKDNGLKVKTVQYRGCCMYFNINDRAKDNHYFPIEIDGIDIYTFIDKIANKDSPVV